MLAHKFEDVSAVDFFERLLAGADAIFQMGPSAPVPLDPPMIAGASGWESHWCAGPQTSAFAKIFRRLFPEHSDAGGGAHETVERLRVCADLTRQFVSGFGVRLPPDPGVPNLREAGDGAGYMSAI